LRQGSDPSRFDVASGETVTIRIVGVGTGQFETVAGPAERLMGDSGEGHVYRFTAEGEPGDRRHVLMSFKFVERFDPPGHYKIQVEGPGATPSFKAASAFQPVGVFPQSVSYALTFVIA
jgi:hypothetical protein